MTLTIAPINPDARVKRPRTDADRARAKAYKTRARELARARAAAEREALQPVTLPIETVAHVIPGLIAVMQGDKLIWSRPGALKESK